MNIHSCLKTGLLISVGSFFLTACNNNETEQSEAQLMESNITPPVAKKENYVTKIHGIELKDDYFWMRLSDEQKNAETPDDSTQNVLDYLNAENDYRESKMKHTEKFQTALFEEMKGRIKENDESAPFKENGYWIKTKYVEGKEYAHHMRTSVAPAAEEELFLDENLLAEGNDYFALGEFEFSEDNNILAYSFDIVSRRQYDVHFKDISTGKMLTDVLKNTSGAITWANDNKTVFYVTKDPQTLRENKIWKHVIGTSQAEDQMIFEEKDETFYSFIYKSKSKKYLFIGSTSTMTSEFQFLKADTPNGNWTVFQERTRGLEYGIAHKGDKFYIKTNLDAQNFRLMSCGVKETSKNNWKEEIAHRENTLLEGVELFEDYMVIEERTQGLTNIRIINALTNEDYYIDFNDPAYVAYAGHNPDFNTNELRFWYTSLTTPGTTYNFNMDTKDRVILKQQEVVGGYDASNYESKRIWATADDGTKIPMSLVYKKGLKLDGSNPTVLYSYGSYGSSTDPTFRSTRLSLIDRGFVWAIAHIRGGEELGRQWYENGKLLNKKNTFTDFNNCAEFLIDEKYTSNEHLYAMGGSAGGLLMGAIINMQPELYNGVIAAVPFVDVINTMLDESIPLTTGEFDEWGNPKEKEYFDYMMSYSPYDQVKKQDYPNLLVTTGYFDSQVQYWEPAKWVAKLRDFKTDNNSLMMYCNMSTGHGGASGRFEPLKETAMEYAFFLDLEGIKN